METVRITSAWFWMGSEGHYPWESPRHRVFVNEFEICTTTVTRQDYSRFLHDTGHSEPKGWHDPALSDPRQPVVGVSWFDAVAFCDWFSMDSGTAYRLPTEAEWERACRGDLVDADYAWGDANPESFLYFRGQWDRPRPVGERSPNSFGIFNMGENVHEWCSDWYSPDYYVKSPAHNPIGPETGNRRVSRGGSWRHLVKATRAAARSSLPPSYRYTDYGFRIVRSS